MLRKSFVFLYMVYNKFQSIILSVFVLGLIDMMAYSDLIASIVAVPELAPFIAAALIVLGIVVYVKKRRKMNRKSN